MNVYRTVVTPPPKNGKKPPLVPSRFSPYWQYGSCHDPLDLGGAGQILDVENLQATQPPEATTSAQVGAGLYADVLEAPLRAPTKPRKRRTPWAPYGASTRPEAKFLAPFRQEIEENLKAYARGLEQALRTEFETIRPLSQPLKGAY
ncbi:hypothetical protein ACJ73_08933 [Blastomyces percursus]|uniref:Uncharacterized protein n=1 Tax=Blastomyces percursus TaxID=1658174 RepID=A0A1J9Q6N1_9EURO|nr:hypothetical protein ACJ73_08933 [Blastomyces percursus]